MCVFLALTFFAFIFTALEKHVNLLPSPGPHRRPSQTSPPVVVLLCSEVNDEAVLQMNAFLRLGLDAHVIPDTVTAGSERVHWVPTETALAAGYSHLNPNMAVNVSAWDRGLLWVTPYAARTGSTHVWFIEMDVWLADGRALLDVINLFPEEGSPTHYDLIASSLLSPGPGLGDDWYWWQDHRISWAMGRTGSLLLPYNHSGGVPGPPLTPLMATFNVLCRLSTRLLNEVAAMAAREGRLVLHEALFPTLVRAKEREGWRLTWFATPWINIRWRPEFSAEEAREGSARFGWRVIHPVKDAWQHLQLRQQQPLSTTP